ncbi:MAG: small multi-drug export protein [Candidatus Aenigmarchaeota archaeon]|nr:small multi-drug export protein [Candidatus Aenigmarchaeota archaeon]
MISIINILQIIAITFLPFLELRASIPYAILKLKMDALSSFFICSVSNIIIGEIVYFSLLFFLPYVLKIKIMDRIYQRCVLKIQDKAHHYVEKYGTIGIAVFIGIPLPGSGVYSGALAAFLLGVKPKQFLIANIVGVTIAGILVTLIVLSGNSAYALFLKGI